ncbi:MAG: ABC transporter substrate-binding protein [Acetobacteraceae bacterium]
MGTSLNRRSFLLQGAMLSTLAGIGTLAGTNLVLAADGGPIPVGILVPLTGGGSPYGPNMLKAFQLTTEDINQAGGPLGRKIALHANDSQTSPDAGVAAAQKLIGINHVVAILGTWSSGVSLAVIPITFEAGILEMNTSGAPQITAPKYRSLVFRTQPTDKPYGVVMARYAKQKGYRKVSLMVLNTPYALAVRAAFEAEWKKLGMQEPASLVYNPGATSYSGEVGKALADHPDLLIIAGYTPDASIIGKDWYAMNVSTHVMGPGFAFNEAFVKNLGAGVVEGFLAVDGVPPVDQPGFNAFAARFKKATGAELADNFWPAQAHDQINLLALAIESAKSLDGKTVAAHVMRISNPPGKEVYDFASGATLLRKGEKINYQGASGPCDFSSEHNVVTNFAVWEFHNGKRKQVASFTAKELGSSAA